MCPTWKAKRSLIGGFYFERWEVRKDASSVLQEYVFSERKTLPWLCLTLMSTTITRTRFPANMTESKSTLASGADQTEVLTELSFIFKWQNNDVSFIKYTLSSSPIAGYLDPAVCAWTRPCWSSFSTFCIFAWLSHVTVTPTVVAFLWKWWSWPSNEEYWPDSGIYYVCSNCTPC